MDGMGNSDGAGWCPALSLPAEIIYSFRARGLTRLSGFARDNMLPWLLKLLLACWRIRTHQTWASEGTDLAHRPERICGLSFLLDARLPSNGGD